MTDERAANVEIRPGAPTANTDAGQTRIRSPVSRWSRPRKGPTSCSNDSIISGTIAPSAPNNAIIRRSGLGDFVSFGRMILRGLAAGELGAGGPHGPPHTEPRGAHVSS